ncbi:zinc ABC transporter substrate-binding protein [Aliiruegeria sabulilitoris]|uniref:zinc ABC transporter substrate-binding protein n=1 Tax=Aliiruegeria sabulilitoris TaxID=1510458 RepID=UPI00082BF45E|nr:zinc ABC transporter substrate-binding protein [Aliiruegeria sabulilitoris]NDR58510.1 zinc ABC transporter substrate-binding protein [Pseudoruegeria sp. M32A2M]
MRLTILTGTTAAIAFCSNALADVPNVATDIAPVHSLVAQVMGDLATPDLILPPGASPHGYSLRPSEARALERADIVFWIGEPLTPWLEAPLATLAQGALIVELLEVPGATILPFREGADLGGHDDHDEAHADTETAHGDDHDAEAEHDHEGIDPHAWLDPRNAIVWTGLIAQTLTKADPEHAAQYAANAEVTIAGLETLTQDISDRLEPMHGVPFVVFHDAYQYFEQRFDLPALGAISFGDATDPGAARVASIRDLVRDSGVSCIAAEPQFNPSLIKTVAGSSGIRTTVLDPMGSALEPGADFYSSLITGLADSLLDCR